MVSGPFFPAAEFAAWSPAEGTSHVGQFVELLRSARAGDHVAQQPPQSKATQKETRPPGRPDRVVNPAVEKC